jgi:hypothetical protein
LSLQLGISVSPRSVEKYLRRGGPVRTPDPKQRWLTFIHNHAKVIVACDFFIVVTATFRILYVFVLLELGSWRIIDHNVNAHPTAEWGLQQFREALPGGHPYRFLIHDRDSIFSRKLDTSSSGSRCAGPSNSRAGTHDKLRMRTSRRDTTSRVLGLLDPIQRTPSEDDHQGVGNPLQPGRPHSALGPDFPEPTQEIVPDSDHRHKLPTGYRVVKRSLLGGLHHEYRLVKEAA